MWESRRDELTNELLTASGDAAARLKGIQGLHKPIDVTIVGAGMFVNDVVLPSLYHLQRIGTVGRIAITSLGRTRSTPCEITRNWPKPFPGNRSRPYRPADLADGERATHYLKALSAMAPPLVVVLPDHFTTRRS